MPIRAKKAYENNEQVRSRFRDHAPEALDEPNCDRICSALNGRDIPRRAPFSISRPLPRLPANRTLYLSLLVE
jgi:hypothetical protein